MKMNMWKKIQENSLNHIQHSSFSTYSFSSFHLVSLILNTFSILSDQTPGRQGFIPRTNNSKNLNSTYTLSLKNLSLNSNRFSSKKKSPLLFPSIYRETISPQAVGFYLRYHRHQHQPRYREGFGLGGEFTP